LPLRNRSKLLSTVMRIVALRAVFPVGVEIVFRKPTVPIAVDVFAFAVDQIQVLSERLKGRGSVAGRVMFCPHDPDPYGAATAAGANCKRLAGVGKSEGIALDVSQLGSDRKSDVVESLYVTWMEARSPGAGSAESKMFSTSTENTFADEFNAALSSCGDFHPSWAVPDAPMG
jgi:hypothetical protein